MGAPAVCLLQVVNSAEPPIVATVNRTIVVVAPECFAPPPDECTVMGSSTAGCFQGGAMCSDPLSTLAELDDPLSIPAPSSSSLSVPSIILRGAPTVNVKQVMGHYWHPWLRR